MANPDSRIFDSLTHYHQNGVYFFYFLAPVSCDRLLRDKFLVENSHCFSLTTFGLKLANSAAVVQ